MVLALWAGCKGTDGQGTAQAPARQGVSVLVRGVDGGRLDAEVEIAGGGGASVPNAAGNLVHDDELPGLFGVWAQGPGLVRTGSGPVVELDRITAVELTVVPARIAVGAPAVDLDGLELELPDGVLVDSLEVPYEGEWELRWLVPEGDERWASPGEPLLLFDDVLEAPLQVLHPFYVQGYASDGEERLRIDGLAPVRLRLPAGAEVTDQWRLYHYSMGAQRWQRGEPVAQVDADGWVTAELRSFGWVGLALEEQARGCVQGSVRTADGAPADGAEVRLLEDGHAAAVRDYVQGGAFCLPMAAGAEGQLRVSWFDASLTRMGATTAAVRNPSTELGRCGEVCADLGEFVLEEGYDGDGDFYYGGPGGDCDDGDPDINPSFAYGDGSWCGP
jgi:hypothetical protein